MTEHSMKKIAIFGNGFAGLLCAAKLVKILPEDIELTYIESSEVNNTDLFFGTVTSPTTYDFLLGLGITEPDILPHTETSFSLGTQYKNWGPENRSWTQSFHRPLPLFKGVNFHHYLTRLRATSPELSEIEDYIMSVQAAKASVFAHPPEGKNIPLADVEYGYHFLPEDWCKVLADKINASSIKWVKSDVLSVIWQDDNIQSISLSNSTKIEADFFINAIGPHSKLANPKPKARSSSRHLKAVSSFTPSENLKSVCRVLTATNYGWQSETPLQNGIHRLSVFTAESEKEALDHNENSDSPPVNIELGKLAAPWSGNCLTLGHGAAIVEPLTPAPVLLLQRDIERLVELIPVSREMAVESREYNRRFHADYEHAEEFTRSLFVTDARAHSPYWQTASALEPGTKLRVKIEQFESRGVTVQYDYEPFSAQDWTLLHLGMGRHPARYDPLADHIPEYQLKNRLNQMSTATKMMAKKMPPHHIYMTGLLKYLKDKHG